MGLFELGIWLHPSELAALLEALDEVLATPKHARENTTKKLTPVRPGRGRQH